MLSAAMAACLILPRSRKNKKGTDPHDLSHEPIPLDWLVDQPRPAVVMDAFPRREGGAAPLASEVVLVPHGNSIPSDQVHCPAGVAGELDLSSLESHLSALRHLSGTGLDRVHQGCIGEMRVPHGGLVVRVPEHLADRQEINLGVRHE